MKYCKNSLENSTKDLDFQRLNKISFEKCPNESFDVSIMEKTNKGIVIPLNYDGMILKLECGLAKLKERQSRKLYKRENNRRKNK